MFLSGNSVCWVSPFRAGSDGRPNRIISRAAPYAGLDRHRKAARGEITHFDSVGPDEGLLMGAVNVIPVNGGGDWVCAQPEHWLFEGTGMKQGDSIRGLVGWEYHGDPAKIAGLEVVGERDGVAKRDAAAAMDGDDLSRAGKGISSSTPRRFSGARR